MSDTSLIFSILAIDKASGILGKVGGAWNKLALAVAGASLEMVSKTTDMAAAFQSSMNRLVTSAGELPSNLAADSAGVLAMMGQVGDSADDLTTALYAINSGGQHGADGLVVLRAAAQGAKAENADLATVGDAVTSVLQDYHLTAAGAADVTSKLVAATSAGKLTFGDLSGSLSSVLPVASAAGVSLNDILAAEASMTVHGMSADQATQDLADTIRHMQNPTQAQQKELAQLGLNASDLAAMLGTKGLTGTVQTVSQTILSKMGPSGKVLLGTFKQSQQAAADVNQMISGMPKNLQDLARQFQAGTISTGDWRKQLKDLAPDQANLLQQFATLQKQSAGFSDALKSGSPAAQTYAAALAKAMGDSTGLNTALMLTGENTSYVAGALNTVSGATADAAGNVKGWSDIQKTASQQNAELKGSLQALGIQVGNVLLPYVTDLIKGLKDVVTWLGKHKDAADALAMSIAALGAGIVLYKGYVAAAKVATVAANAASLLWKGTQAAITAASKAWAAAQWLVNAALNASPLTLIITGIGLLVAGIVYLATKTQFFQTIWNTVWGGVKAGWNAISAFFTKTIPAAFQAVIDWLKGNWPLVLGILTGPFGLAVVEIIKHWDSVVAFFRGIGSTLAKAGAHMWDWAVDAFKITIDAVITVLNAGIHGINTMLHYISDAWSWTGLAPIPPIHDVPMLASGGRITKAGLVTVGERGAETVALPKGATVYPHGATAAAAGPCVHVSVNVPARVLVTELAREIRTNHRGSVQLALGGNTP